jgi:predicted amidohydrolase
MRTTPGCHAASIFPCAGYKAGIDVERDVWGDLYKMTALFCLVKSELNVVVIVANFVSKTPR